MSYIIQKVPIESVGLNPSNPRKIIDEQFERLKRSIQKFPKMLELRPLIVNDKNQVIGGNMRLLAMIKLGFKEVSIINASDLTPDEIKQFIVLDNISFGFWDYDMLGLTYEHMELIEMGMPDFDLGFDAEEKEPENLTGAKEDKKPTIKITFDIIENLEDVQPKIEELLKGYAGVTLSVSAGKL